MYLISSLCQRMLQWMWNCLCVCFDLSTLLGAPACSDSVVKRVLYFKSNSFNRDIVISMKNSGCFRRVKGNMYSETPLNQTPFYTEHNMWTLIYIQILGPFKSESPLNPLNRNLPLTWNLDFSSGGISLYHFNVRIKVSCIHSSFTILDVVKMAEFLKIRM